MRHIERLVGRLIGVQSLRFLVAIGLGACAPTIPGPGGVASTDPASAAHDAGAGGSPGPVAPARGPAGPPPPPGATTGSRGDAAASAPADATADVSRGDAGLTVSRPDAGADVSRGDAGDADRRPVGDGATAEAALEATAAARPPRAGEVVIDEVLVDPAGNDLGHEWLEIVNVAGDELALAALHLSDGVTDVAVDAGLLSPGARLVLGQSLDHAHNGDAPVDRAYGTRLSLNNGADRIALCLGACADGLELDAFAWTMAWGDAYVGHAIVIATGATCAAQDAYGTAGNFGTPGRPNPPCPSSPDAGAD
jgi:hypothetical protein